MPLNIGKQRSRTTKPTAVILILLFGAAAFFYLLVYKQEIFASVLFTLIIADVNIDIPGSPLNSRALMTLALFARIMLDRDHRNSYPAFISRPSVIFFLLYMGLTLLISYAYDLYTFDLLKVVISTVLATYCVYHFYFKVGNTFVLKAAIIASGLICFADLAYTYGVFGSFPVRRLSNLITGKEIEVDPNNILVSDSNHNFFGQICGMAFVFVFADIIKNPRAHKWEILLIPAMLLGVVMSTSRSALMSLIVVAVFIGFTSFRYQEQRKKVIRISVFMTGAALTAMLLFSTIAMSLNLDSKFVDELVNRLAEEPIAIIQKAMGQSYNVQNLGSMDWRKEAAAEAYTNYTKLELTEQVFGIGEGGYIQRNLGHGLNTHNGVLLILIQYGMFGFLVYLLLVGAALVPAFLRKNVTASFGVILFMLLYGIGQNQEMTSVTTMLFVVHLVAENELFAIKSNQVLRVARRAGRPVIQQPVHHFSKS